MSRIGLAALWLAFVCAPGVASACGGFFCSQVPVDQSGEHILFAVEGTTVTAHIQIAYQGEAEKFSWVLPLPSEPSKIQVGTDLLFQRLRQMTDPRFMVEWQNVDGCAANNDCMFPSAAGGVDQNSPPSDPDDGGVNVIQEGEVGPFEYKVVEGAGEALFTWLNDNGYDQPESSQPIVTHYANQEYKFVAVKLIKGKASGDLQPLVLTFDSPTLACVPLRLTGIAATPDMPIWTWVLGKARAVPLNFFQVLLNAKAYPWLACDSGSYFGGGFGGPIGPGSGNNTCADAYLDLVTEAADTANGHAFVTEYAGASAIMDNQIYQEGQLKTDGLSSQETPYAFLQAMLSAGFPRNALVQELIKTWIPRPDDEALPPECQGDSSFYNMGNIENCLQYMEDGWVFDPVGFANDLQERIVKPMMEAQGLFTDFSYMTRFFTTISPDEMTKDPMFSFNPDLPDVSNQHTVKATPICAPGESSPIAVELEFGDGQKQVVEGSFPECSPFQALADPTDGQPAAAGIQVLSESGDPENISPEDVDTTEPTLDTRAPNPEQASVEQRPEATASDVISGTFGPTPEGTPTTTGAGTPGSGSSSDSSSGCTTSTTPVSGTGLMLLGGLAALLLGLRRRREFARSPVSAMIIVLGLTGFAPADAEACGGFFCSQTPVDQVGEHIAFAVEGTTVTAHIQIAYQGEADKFSWVLPLPSAPSVVNVGTEALFQRLRNVTDPRFNIQWQDNEGCKVPNECQFDMASEGGGPTAGSGGGGDVNVIDEGEVGPFEYKVVEGAGEALFTWLNDNGYDQPDSSQAIVTHYANQEYKFVAVKLIKGKAAGDLQPLVLTFESPSLACVPLRLTGIAASADMPIWTWVLGKARAVPLNFFHVLLNAKAYPWLQCAQPSGEGPWVWSNNGNFDCQGAYVDLVTEAANAANGHGFVTEYAGASSVMDNQVYQEGQLNTSSLAATSGPEAFLQEMLSSGFPRTPLVQEIIKTWIPKPAAEDLPSDCQSDQDFYAMGNIEHCLQSMPEGWSFDAAGMAADLDTRVVQPMKDAQQLFTDYSYMTRFFTTVSPDEMTKDPMFSFNGDLPDVSNEHTIKATPQCEAGSETPHAVEIEYPDGQKAVVTGSFTECGGFDSTVDVTVGEPAAAEIQILGESGGAETVPAGDVATREPELDKRAPNPQQASVEQRPEAAAQEPISGFGTSPPGSGGTTNAGTGSGSGGSSSGCTASSGSSSTTPALVLLGVIGLLGLLRRRRSALVAACLVAVVSAPGAAHACGGFFCSQVPVEQKGEQILFAVDGTTVTAHIMIAYQGEAEKFSWVLPLPSEPTIKVGSDITFQRLRAMTDPRFEIQWNNDDDCAVTNTCWAVPEADFDGDGGGDPSAGGGVNVLSEGEVGPFEFKVVEGAGEALFAWLNDNGYDQPEDAKPLVQYYANQEFKFVAVKLIKGKSSGDLQPLVVTYENPSLACVPLKLTSIAASADM
ncbi:MAG: MYXO-CTERM domain-containing protein, partial [Myxococcota bacterium]